MRRLPVLVLILLPLAMAGCSLPLLFDALSARMDAEDNPGPREIVREEFNYRFVSPGLPYVEVKPEHINPEASLVLMRTQPTVFFMVIAERSSNESMGSEGLTEVVRGMLRSRFPDSTLGDASVRTVNGIDGQQFDARLSIDGSPFAYTYWVAAAGGSFVQLIAWAREEEKATLGREVDTLLPGFHLLDPMAGSVAQGQAFGRHQSARFGYSVDLTGTPWMLWDDLETSAAEADCGAIRSQGAFLVIPFAHDDPRPAVPALSAALLSSMGIEFPSPDVQDVGLLKVPSGAFRRLRHQREIDGTRFSYTLQIVEGERVSLLVAVWSARDQAHADQLADALMPALHVEEPVDEGTALPPRLIHAQATLRNGLGLYLFRTEQYERAARAFEQALDLVPDEATYLTNALDAFNRMGAHARAVELIATHAAPHGGLPAVRAWKAWHLKQAGRQAEALETYRELFRDGHGDDEDRRSYVDLLEQAGLWDEATVVLAEAAERTGSLALRLEQARLLQRRGDHPAAVTMLRELRTSNPDDVELTLALVQSYQELDRPDEVLSLTDALIARDVAAASLHQARGLALVRLERLPEAKLALEQALGLEPGNAQLQHELELVSAQLGEGDNSSLKARIEALPAPSALQARMDRLRSEPGIEGYGSTSLYQVRIRQFRPGEPLRRTLYQCVRVRDAAAAARQSTLTFDFDPLREQMHVNALEVRDAHDRVIARGAPDTYYVVDKSGDGPQTHERTLHLPVPKLAPGHTVCLTLSSQHLAADETLPFERVLLAGPQPSRLSALVYLVDPAQLRSAQANLEAPQPVAGGLLWQIEDTPALAWEPQVQQVERFAPVVHVADAQATWASEVQAYLQRIAPSLEVEPGVRALADDTAGTGIRGDALVERLAQQVRQSTTYKAIEFGSRGRDPARPSTTLARRYGDCKDHAVLLRALLRARGVDAELALVNTVASVREDLPSLDQFNHMVVYVPGRGGGRFVDTTEKNMPVLVAAPLGLAGRRALILTRTAPRFIAVPSYAPSEAQVQVQRQVELGDGDLLTVREKVQLDGIPAASLRHALAELDGAEHLRWAQALIARQLPGATLRSFSVHNLEQPEQGLKLELEYLLQGRVTRGEKKVLRVRTADPWARYFLVAPAVPQRRTPFETSVPVQVSSTTTLQAPGGYKVERAERQRDTRRGPFGSWKIQHSASPATASLSLSAQVTAGQFGAADYASYRGFFDDALVAVDREWTLRPTP
ncbi:MAG: transglutaminase domain-containing protein [Pseudomonadota bacterium]